MGKRLFYEDDEQVINKPGTVTEITKNLKEQESSHGNISFVEGMGIRSTSFLEEKFRCLRKELYDKLSVCESELGTQKSSLLNEYNTLRNHVEEVISEPVLPNLIYILTSTLTGSILVNRRALPLRFATPLLFGGASLWYFMPKTYDNLAQKYCKFEEEKFPEFHKQKHEVLYNSYAEYKSKTKELTEETNSSIQKSVHNLRVFLKDTFAGEK